MSWAPGPTNAPERPLPMGCSAPSETSFVECEEEADADCVKAVMLRR